MFALDIKNLDVSGSYTDMLLVRPRREKCVELIYRQPNKDPLNVVGLWGGP